MLQIVGLNLAEYILRTLDYGFFEGSDIDSF